MKNPTKYKAAGQTADPEAVFCELAREFPGNGRPTGQNLPSASDPPPLVPERPEGAIEIAARTGRAPLVPRLPIADPSAGPTFSIDRFADELRNRLDGNCIGWAFVINLNGQEARADSGGQAILAGETDQNGNAIEERDFTPDTRVMVASVSKTITAVAVLRLLDELNLDIKTPIWPFLPTNWTLGTNVEQLNFEHLLRHQTGFTVAPNAPEDAMLYEGLRLMVQNGASPGAPRRYFNGNFALFRVIIPALWRGTGRVPARNDTDIRAAFFYGMYVIDELFGRMGDAIGPQASISRLEDSPTLYYDDANSTSGILFPDWTLSSGGNGWYMTARELAAFMAFITYDDSILSPSMRTLMDDLRMGWRRASTYPGAFGNYWGHGGVIDWNSRRVRTGVMKFNIQVEASLVINSGLSSSGGSATTALWQAYDAAWT